jgi:hypothetical protein
VNAAASTDSQPKGVQEGGAAHVTAKYPAQATPRKSSLSRVPENGTHGLKEEIKNGLA